MLLCKDGDIPSRSKTDVQFRWGGLPKDYTWGLTCVTLLFSTFDSLLLCLFMASG
jgi:hypothetical protein